MKITLLLFTLFSQLSIFANEQFVNDSIKVLFVGNSLTYYNEMPQLLQQMLNEGEEKVKVEQSTFPGMQLRHHLITIKSDYHIGTPEDPNNLNLSKEKLRNSNWEYVILQEGTVSFLIPEYVQNSLKSTFSNILAEFGSPKTKFILFQTWAPSNYYPQTYCRPKRPPVDYNSEIEDICSPVITNRNQEIEIIKKSCEELAAYNKMILSKNGELFYKFNLQFPELRLYDEEGHPTKAGAFMNACVFYEVFTNKKAKDLLFLSNLDIKTVVQIKKFVSENNF